MHDSRILIGLFDSNRSRHNLMRLSWNWNEIRTRAAKFADQWQGTVHEKGETSEFLQGLL